MERRQKPLLPSRQCSIASCRTGAPLRIELRLLQFRNRRGELRVFVLFVLTCTLFRRASPHEEYRAPPPGGQGRTASARTTSASLVSLRGRRAQHEYEPVHTPVWTAAWNQHGGRYGFGLDRCKLDPKSLPGPNLKILAGPDRD